MIVPKRREIRLGSAGSQPKLFVAVDLKFYLSESFPFSQLIRNKMKKNVNNAIKL
jgi:hypothetical protein